MFKFLKDDEAPFILHWNVWSNFFRGIKDFLSKNLRNLVERFDNKREKKVKPLTKQKVESVYDINLTKSFLKAFSKDDEKRAKMHLTEEIRHFKCGKECVTDSKKLNSFLKKTLATFKEDYIMRTKKMLFNLQQKKIEKVEYKKMIGRLYRLDFKKERQISYLKNGPDFSQLCFFEDFLKILL